MKRPRRSRHSRRALWATLALAPAACGSSPAATVPACAPAPADAPVSVAHVGDALDVTLADGRSLRLAGLDPPRATAAAPDLPARAGHSLGAWLSEAGPLTLHLLASTPDRWGRLPALLFHGAPAQPPGPSAAEALVRAGFGRARPDPLVHGCFPALLAAEDAARLDRFGLWADPAQAVIDAGDGAGLAGQAGGLVLVEGILHVHEARGALYLSLGRDRWGFSAVLSRRDAARFGRGGLDVRDYDGTPVRLRGDLDVRFGPRMRLTDPDQMESLEPGSLAPPSAPDATAPARDDARDRPRATGR